jgi:hypothetical protein
VLVLRELAVNAPTLFYAQIGNFFKVIFVALRDSKVHQCLIRSLGEAHSPSLRCVFLM